MESKYYTPEKASQHIMLAHVFEERRDWLPSDKTFSLDYTQCRSVYRLEYTTTVQQHQEQEQTEQEPERNSLSISQGAG